MSVLDFPKPITQRDIARAMGVSVATVSLALRNRPVLSESTRQEIQRFAVQAGYRLDEAAAELSGRKKAAIQPITENLAWITPRASADPSYLHRCLDDCRSGAEIAARKLGYQLEEFELGAGLIPTRLHQILHARGIRCMLLAPGVDRHDWKDFPWERYSIVRFGQSDLLPAFHSVSSDHIGNVTKAFRTVLLKGYRRIGLLTRESGANDHESQLIEAGFLTAQRFVGEEAKIPILTIPGGSNGTARIAKWVEQHRVEAVLSDFDEAPVFLKNAGLRIPQDLGLAMLNIGGTTASAGIDSHPEEIGKTGVQLLHSLLTDNERGLTETPRQLLVNGGWSDGDFLPRVT